MKENKKNIEIFFEKWGLDLIKKNTEHPKDEQFMIEFKKMFEKNVKKIIGNKVFRVPFLVCPSCPDAILDIIITTQIFYKKINVEEEIKPEEKAVTKPIPRQKKKPCKTC